MMIIVVDITTTETHCMKKEAEQIKRNCGQIHQHISKKKFYKQTTHGIKTKLSQRKSW